MLTLKQKTETIGIQFGDETRTITIRRMAWKPAQEFLGQLAKLLAATGPAATPLPIPHAFAAVPLNPRVTPVSVFPLLPVYLTVSAVSSTPIVAIFGASGSFDASSNVIVV